MPPHVSVIFAIHLCAIQSNNYYVNSTTASVLSYYCQYPLNEVITHTQTPASELTRDAETETPPIKFLKRHLQIQLDRGNESQKSPFDFGQGLHPNKMQM